MSRLKLDKPMCFLDVESTGLDIAKDRIVSLTVNKLELDGTESLFEWMFNPGFHMDPEVIAIHGITDEMVKDKPLFLDEAAFVAFTLSNSDFCGYNLLNFDIPILWEELFRCGIDFDMSAVRIVDAGNIFKMREPRDLSAALKFYCGGREHTGAHSATADVLATRDVLFGQLEKYQDLPSDVAELAKYSSMDTKRVDLCGLITINKEGLPAFNTKRNRGVAVVDDIGYAQWMLRGDFPASTKLAIEKILRDVNKDRVAALRRSAEVL